MAIVQQHLLHPIGESFVLTLQKDKISGDITKKRINVRKILSIDDVINKPYSKVTIQLKNNYDLNEIKELLSSRGETEINLIVKEKIKQALFSLKQNRKFQSIKLLLEKLLLYFVIDSLF